VELKRYLEELEFPLNEQPDAAAIKKRWKELCRKHHPDHGGEEEKFKSITHAYKMLTDLAYRTKNKPLGKDNLNLTIQYPLRFEEAYAGTKKVFSYAVTEIGPDGIPVSKSPETPLEIETLTVEVPPGSFADDFVLKFSGKGMRKGDERGDVILLPQRIPHAQFTAKAPAIFLGPWGRRADNQWDIESRMDVPLHTLLTGKKISVMTMHGMKKVKIPPGTVPGSAVRIEGLGCNGGAHLVVIGVLYPNASELKTKKWENLEIDWGEGKEDEEEQKLLKDFEEIIDG